LHDRSDVGGATYENHRTFDTVARAFLLDLETTAVRQFEIDERASRRDRVVIAQKISRGSINPDMAVIDSAHETQSVRDGSVHADKENSRADLSRCRKRGARPVSRQE
jgi:hypothetical protein